MGTSLLWIAGHSTGVGDFIPISQAPALCALFVSFSLTWWWCGHLR